MPRKVVAWCFRTGHMAWQANDGIFVTFRNICTGTRLKWTILVCVFLPELLTNQRVNSAVVVNPGRNLCYLSLCVCVRVCQCVCVWLGGGCVLWIRQVMEGGGAGGVDGVGCYLSLEWKSTAVRSRGGDSSVEYTSQPIRGQKNTLIDSRAQQHDKPTARLLSLNSVFV